MIVQAELNIWVLLIIWAAIMILSPKKKRPQPGATGPAGAGEPTGLMGQLNRALEELKRAEQEALARRQGTEPPRLPPAAPRSGPAPKAAAYRLGTRGEGAPTVKRQVYYPKGKAVAKPGRSVAPRPIEFDPDQSFEDPTVISLERLDYDEDAEQLIQARRAAAEQRDGSREDGSVEGMSAAQLARRADRAPAEAIGGIAQHEAWHQKRDAMIAPAPAAEQRSRGLARFAGGRARDAIVLSEILGRPVGDR